WIAAFHKQTGTLLYSLYVSCFFVCKVIEEFLALQCVLYRMLTDIYAKASIYQTLYEIDKKKKKNMSKLFYTMIQH
ncbi:hypothetical protein ACMSEH_15250, partial [Bacteroides thetaiotaomicron]|uniref:hypothetical protein n=1 Tax=Bacteroides thetaiotaomicron TaxID=818 RepID=UPI0039C2DFF7